MTLPPSFQVTLCVLLAAGGCYIQALLVLPVAIYSGHKIVKHCGLEALTSNILERAEVFGNAPRAERTCAACDCAVPCSSVYVWLPFVPPCARLSSRKCFLRG